MVNIPLTEIARHPDTIKVLGMPNVPMKSLNLRVGLDTAMVLVIERYITSEEIAALLEIRDRVKYGEKQ